MARPFSPRVVRRVAREAGVAQDGRRRKLDFDLDSGEIHAALGSAAQPGQLLSRNRALRTELVVGAWRPRLWKTFPLCSSAPSAANLMFITAALADLPLPRLARDWRGRGINTSPVLRAPHPSAHVSASVVKSPAPPAIKQLAARTQANSSGFEACSTLPCGLAVAGSPRPPKKWE